MKLNMKRVALGLCMAACLFLLSACGKADMTSAEVNPGIKIQLSQMASGLLNSYANIPEDQFEAVKKQTAKQSPALADGVDSWSSIKDEMGALVAIDDGAEVEAMDDGYDVTIHAVFEKREMNFSITTDDEGNVTSVSFAPKYTLLEDLEQGTANMLMGMGTVFIVLIFISFLISGFKYINMFETKMRNKKRKTEPIPEPVFTPAPVVETEEENLAGDVELVAVITAAIAAETGASPEGLVVRSIRRAPAGRWKKA